MAEHLAYHREHPSPHATHLGAATWGVDPGWLGALLGARASPRMTPPIVSVAWSHWHTDNWSFKRALVDGEPLFDPGYRLWGWEDFDLGWRLTSAALRQALAIDVGDALCGLALARGFAAAPALADEAAALSRRAPGDARLLAGAGSALARLIVVASLLGAPGARELAAAALRDAAACSPRAGALEAHVCAVVEATVAGLARARAAA